MLIAYFSKQGTMVASSDKFNKINLSIGTEAAGNMNSVFGIACTEELWLLAGYCKNS